MFDRFREEVFPPCTLRPLKANLFLARVVPTGRGSTEDHAQGFVPTKPRMDHGMKRAVEAKVSTGADRE